MAEAFDIFVHWLEQIIFWDPLKALGITSPASFPLVVLWLISASLYFSLRLGFRHFRLIPHAFALVWKSKNKQVGKGEITPFQALSTALSATVGLGNIAGVAVAVSIGGPGAVFWMWISALLGMASKLVECTLGVKYRTKNKDGQWKGGPMYYLDKAFHRKDRKISVLGFLFSMLCAMGAIGGGNMLQANQAFSILSGQWAPLLQFDWLFGLALALLAGLSIMGGIKSIAKVTSALVPAMALIYLLGAMVVLFFHFHAVPGILTSIFAHAFGLQSFGGGVAGALMVGLQRASFSNEAGIGSSAIAHAAARCKTPVEEGLVAMLEPLFDTLFVCTLTALVVLAGADYANSPLSGAPLTASAFASVWEGFQWVLTVAVMLFAFSTILSWGYYGQEAWTYVFKGRKSLVFFQFFYLGAIVLGSCSNLPTVLAFSDMMILTMSFPNVVGLIYFFPEIKADLLHYLRQRKSVG